MVGDLLSGRKNLTVYIAHQIHTMNPSLPHATAVVVADGMIVEVGTRESIQPWLRVVTTALHSDFTLAPAKPLVSAWVAANRLGEQGAVLAPEERINVHQALQAITINAAYVLGMENEVGSIRSGKKADFTVLEADAYETPVEALKDIAIWGTVFEGTPFPRHTGVDD